MREPEIIKRSLKRCYQFGSGESNGDVCKKCAYRLACWELFADALAYIERLEQRTDALTGECNRRVKFTKPGESRGYVVVRPESGGKRSYLIDFREDGMPMYCDCAAEEFATERYARLAAEKCTEITGIKHNVVGADIAGGKLS